MRNFNIVSGRCVAVSMYYGVVLAVEHISAGQLQIVIFVSFYFNILVIKYNFLLSVFIVQFGVYCIRSVLYYAFGFLFYESLTFSTAL